MQHAPGRHLQAHAECSRVLVHDMDRSTHIRSVLEGNSHLKTRLPLVVALLVASLACTAVASPSSVSVHGVTLTRENVRAHWSFHFTYPVATITGALMGGQGVIGDFNRHERQEAENSLHSFTKTVENWSEGTSHLPDSAVSSRTVTFAVAAKSSSIISLRFDETQYLRGQAHPVSRVFTRNFLNGRFIALENIFKRGQPWLDTISRQVIDAVRAQALRRHFNIVNPQGYGPKARNFEAFTVTRFGLVIYLQQYQVAPSYIGTMTAILPWKQLDPMLNEEFQQALDTLSQPTAVHPT